MGRLVTVAKVYKSRNRVKSPVTISTVPGAKRQDPDLAGLAYFLNRLHAGGEEGGVLGVCDQHDRPIPVRQVPGRGRFLV